MITYTVYTESGGTYKTTTAANLARAHVEQGLDPLVIDLDHQKGNLSHLFDVADDQANPDADHLARHLIDRPRGAFEELIRETPEGIDVLPAHDKLEDIQEMVRKLREIETQMDGDDAAFNEYSLLLDTLRDAGVPDDYDAVIVDPNARAELTLYNALYATRHVVAPVEFGGKGTLSMDGLEDLGAGFSAEHDIDIGVLAVVPNNVSNTTVQQTRRSEIEDRGFAVPVTIGQRESLMKEMWEINGSAFRVVENESKDGEPGARRVPDRERETLEKLRRLADHVTAQFDVDYTPAAEQEVSA